MRILAPFLLLESVAQGVRASGIKIAPAHEYRNVDPPLSTSVGSSVKSMAMNFGNASEAISPEVIAAEIVAHEASSPHPVDCVELIGGQPISCSAQVCGGEDPNDVGHCLSKSFGGSQCQCLKQSSNPVLTTVTVTQSSSTVVGTYALQTLTSYSGLRQKITTTITPTQTISGGGAALQTAAAVILAGGVTWALWGFLGDAAVVEAIEPPETADGHQDDDTCPAPNPKCPDCGGVQAVCATGTAAGCHCDEAGCPTGDQQPKCLDKACNGDENHKCTTKELLGCTCTPEPCRELLLTPPCSACGGGVDNKCKGIKESNYLWKDCTCIDDSLQISHGRLRPPRDWAKRTAKFKALKPITPGSYRNGPAKPVCQNAGWTAPQRDENGSPSVTSKINEWCAAMDGKTITKQPDGVDTLFSMYGYAYYSFWLSARTWYGPPGDNQCEKTSTITKDECIEMLTDGMTTCDPNSGTTAGASLTGKCIQYNITLDGGADPQSPPWNPLPSSANPQCDTSQMSGVQSNFFSGLYPQFCSAVNADATKAASKDLTSADFSTPKRSLDRRTPPPSTGQYPGFKFHMDWTGSKGDCRKDCSAAFDSIVQSACGHSGGESNGMAMKGSLDVGCGTYSYEITPAEKKPPPPPDVKCAPVSSQYFVTDDGIYEHAKEYCTYVNGLGPVVGGTKYPQLYNDKTPDNVIIEATFDGDGVNLVSQATEADCNTAIKQLLDNCKGHRSDMDFGTWNSGKTSRTEVSIYHANQLTFFTGGQVSVSGVTYLVRPTIDRSRNAQDSDKKFTYDCIMGYNIFFNSFSIWGYGWAGADWGQSKLLPNLRRCSVITDWNFEYNGNAANGEHGEEWLARGSTIIGPQMWGCATQAIVDAGGGPGASGCRKPDSSESKMAALQNDTMSASVSSEIMLSKSAEFWKATGVSLF